MYGKKAPVGKAKAKKMMKEGEIGGKAMTPKQKGLFGAVAGGNFKGTKKKG